MSIHLVSVCDYCGMRSMSPAVPPVREGIELALRGVIDHVKTQLEDDLKFKCNACAGYPWPSAEAHRQAVQRAIWGGGQQS